MLKKEKSTALGELETQLLGKLYCHTSIQTTLYNSNRSRPNIISVLEHELSSGYNTRAIAS